MEVYENHSTADIYPEMDQESFDKLVEDIRKHGQRESIKLFEGKILDGRHRYKACLALRIDPVIEDVYPDDAVAYVVSLNSVRRHLDKGQLSLCAAKAKGEYEKQAKKRQKAAGGNKIDSPQKTDEKALGANLPTAPSKRLQQETKGRARDQAGKAFGVSGRMVEMAEKLIEHGDQDLVEAVERGDISLNKALAEIRPVSDAELEERRKKLPEGFQSMMADRKPAEPLTEQQKKEGWTQTENTASGAMQYVDFAILQLIRIEKDDPNRAKAFQKLKDWMRDNE